MRRRLERLEVRNLVIAAIAMALSVWALWIAGSAPMTPQLQRLVAGMCPHWTEC